MLWVKEKLEDMNAVYSKEARNSFSFLLLHYLLTTSLLL